MLFSTTCPDRDRAKEIKAEFLAALGLTNDWGPSPWPLPNAEETTESKFWDWRTTWNFSAEIWTGQQRYEGRWGHLLLYWLNHGHLLNGGFGVLVLRDSYPKPSTVRYFEWRACAHEFDSQTTGNCQHRYTCRKCGAFYDVDSSG